MKIVLSVLTLALICSCSSSGVSKAVPLTKKGQEVQWGKRVQDSSCEVVGQIVGENDFGSVEVARNDARNKAGEIGANFLLVKDEVVNGKEWKIHGVAYHCP